VVQGERSPPVAVKVGRSGSVDQLSEPRQHATTTFTLSLVCPSIRKNPVGYIGYVA